MNVLFVEDSLITQTLVKGTTEKEFPCIHLTCVETLQAAREALEGVDVIVLDLGLPDADHEEVFQWITDCRKPVVIYTASTEPEVAFEAVQAGALNIVCKGTPASQLVMGMYVAMAEHRLQEDERERRRVLAERLQEALRPWCEELPFMSVE